MVPVPPLLHSIVTLQTLSGCRYIEPHFLATTERSPWEAFLYGFKTSSPLVFDAKNDVALAGVVQSEFRLSF